MHRFPLLSLLLLFGLAHSTLLGQHPTDIGTRRELFVDRALIAELDGAELRLQTPQSRGVALALDRPWEGIVSGYVTVLQDGPQYRMYYRGRPSTSASDASEEAREVSCVAESVDGLHWTRPSLQLFEVSGTRDNNVFLVQPKNVTHNFCPFLDSRPGVPPAERYKAVGGTGSAGLFGYVSADGLHWQPVSPQPLITRGFFDSQNVVFWSIHEQKYLCYFRTSRGGIRWVARATSTDFRTWSDPVEMEFAGAPPEHIYINQTQPYFRAPHIYLGLAARFNEGRRALTEEQVEALNLENPSNYPQLRSDDSDAVLLSSRGGTSYDRTFPESFLRPGTDPRNWVARANYPALGMIQTATNELSFFVVRHYGQPSIHVERMAVRLDGFAAVHAPYSGGVLVTQPVIFGGAELELNLSTGAAGFVQVELQDEDGFAIPGCSQHDCPEIIGDAVDRVVRWNGGTDLSALAGRTVRLRFVMKDADLFSYRFRPAESTTLSPITPATSTVLVCTNAGAGGYEAFPDVCRLADGRLQCVFYASYTHVGVPNTNWPWGGKIAVTRSSDEGRTWTPPETLYDTAADDRDPSITQLRDGRLVCTYFTPAGTYLIEAAGPEAWWTPARLLVPNQWVSSPVRELSDGTWILGGYLQKDDRATGFTLRSVDRGISWESPASIDPAGQFLPAETDVIELKNGELYAALRGGKGSPMSEARSTNRGQSWSPARGLGFEGHCPYLHRLPGGEIVLAYRQPAKGPAHGTAMRISRDETQSWSEPIRIDPVTGAYPSLVNLADGSTLVVYYEEGRGSNLRARKFRLEADGIRWRPF